MEHHETTFDVNSPLSLMDFFKRLFAHDFMPHGHCYYFRPDVLWLNVSSDAIIALSYYMIPISLIYIAIKRQDVPFHKIFYLFGAFILACGTTHLISIYTVWIGMYRVEAIAKLITAILSVLTVVTLIPLLPTIIALPNIQQAIEDLTKKRTELEKSNNELQNIHELFLNREERILEMKVQINKLNALLGKEPPYKL